MTARDRMIDEWRTRIDRALADAVAAGTAPARLQDAMRYALLGGGKRLRPLLVVATAAAAEGAPGRFADVAIAGAVAVEYVHTYSLIHDDLPALDDDDTRRGRPSLHKAFDEATAILAGDALLTDAFAILAAAPNAAAQVRELALAAGSGGMVGGQFDDVAGAADLAALTSVHARKTGCLFTAACALGALAAGAPDARVERARDLGRRLGLAFQIADDVIDVVSGRG